MSITNYALIDHVGSVEDMKIYNTVYKLAAEAGFHKKNKAVWTMKATCLTYPNAQKTMENPDSYKKLKNVVRFNKHPKHVYLICDTIDNSDVKNAVWCWEQNFVPVTIVSEYDGIIEDTREYDFSLKISRYRRCAMIWSKALGWEFSAPLIHNESINTPDSWLKRQDRAEMMERDPKHVTKISTNPDKFVNTFHTIASEDECKAFFQHYRWLYENNLLTESLEPDWTICPTCGRPIRLGTAESITCDFCDTEIHSEVFETYYDDSYKEDIDEWN